MKCKCDDRRHDSLGTAVWHRAYCNWYDAKKLQRPRRAAVWGRIADLAARFA